MVVTKLEKIIIPQTPFGKKFALGYIDKLRKQEALMGWKEDTNVIIIESRYRFTINEDEDD